MSKPVAIVAAMQRELGPLARHAKLRQLDGVYLYELPSALLAIGGIGRNNAQRAAELAVREAGPTLLVSAGIAGALTPHLKAGDIVRVRDVVDEATGEHYATIGGDAVLVTSSRVAGIQGKRRLAALYAASAVDMEGAAVARVAKERGISFAALKAISDELDFPMPPLGQFVDARGQFHELAFAGFVAVRPKWWLPAVRLANNSQLAVRNLADALNHLIDAHAEAIHSQTKTLA
jgi:adenosylhomocysteine nucleosidase